VLDRSLGRGEIVILGTETENRRLKGGLAGIIFVLMTVCAPSNTDSAQRLPLDFRASDVSRNVEQSMPPHTGAGQTIEVARERRFAAGDRDGIPLRADSIGPSFNVGGGAVYGSAPGPQINGAIATNGAGYLVVWGDLRNGSWDLYGTRLAEDGSPLDSSGIAISIESGDQTGPALTYNGTCYFVVWQDSRNGSDDIYGARVTPDGLVLDPFGIPLVTAPIDVQSPDIAFDGLNQIVVWQDSSSGSYDVYALRIDGEGDAIDAGAIALTVNPEDQGHAAVGFNGADYLVVWQDRRNGTTDIYGTRVSAGGCVLDSAGIPVSLAEGDQKQPDIASSGGTSLVVWQDSRASFDEVYGARLDSQGAVLDPSGIPISTGYYEPWSPRASFDGANYLVVWDDWQDPYGVRAARVDTGGSVLDLGGVAISAAEGGWAPDMVFNGADYFLIWQDGACGSYDMFGARMSVELVPLDSAPTDISLATRDQRAPAVSYDGSNHLVVWTEHYCADADLRATRVGTDGTVLDQFGIAVSAAPGNQAQPALAFGITDYFVVWQDSRDGPYEYCDIYGTRVTPGGAVVDPSGIPISLHTMSQEEPDIAFDGVNYLVVWQKEVLGPISDIYGARVDVEGEILDPEGIAISDATDTQEYPAVAFDGVNYVVVWQDKRNGGRYDIYAARVGSDGAVIDTSGILVSDAAWSQKQPDVAFDGVNYLIAWHDQRNGYPPDIYAARLSTDGAVLDPSGIPVSTSPGGQTGVAVAFDGTNFLVGWKESGEGFSDTYVARISTDGIVLDPDGFPVSAADQNQLSPAISIGPSSLALIAYSSLTPEVYGSYRIWGNFIGSCAGHPGTADGHEARYLYQNWPNPFRGSTTISFSLPETCPFLLGIYSVNGQLVRSLREGKASGGLNRIEWDGNSDRGLRVAPGVYFCRMEAGAYAASRKMVVLE
jgi:hypothetical protein